MEERRCDECPYADNYYGRVRPVLYRLLTECQELDADTFSRYGEEASLCPFELSLDASLYASLIVCDYNYVFDPAVYLRRTIWWTAPARCTAPTCGKRSFANCAG